MDYKAVLFDLDGTLLSLDQDLFDEMFFGLIGEKFAAIGYDAKEVSKAVWDSTGEMIKNQGEDINENVFWKAFHGMFKFKDEKDIELFDDYYKNEFQKIETICNFSPIPGEIVKALKEKGIRLVLATNPVYPAIGIESRMKWAGLSTDDFELYTHYENCRYTKPSLGYYRDIADFLGLAPEDCVMIGNNIVDDMPAREIGMKVFLSTDNLINEKNVDISQFPNGDFDAMKAYLGI